MNEILFSIVVPKNFGSGLLIGFLFGFFVCIIMCIYENNS